VRQDGASPVPPKHGWPCHNLLLYFWSPDCDLVMLPWESQGGAEFRGVKSRGGEGL
jgi:hypothetical protein